jgi:hypothetical protein
VGVVRLRFNSTHRNTVQTLQTTSLCFSLEFVASPPIYPYQGENGAAAVLQRGSFVSAPSEACDYEF